MARVTVEDCVDKIPNRFELVMMASQRARGISAGAQLTVDRDNDKNPVVSLREIAEDTVSTEELTEELIKSLQTFVAIDEPEHGDMDLLGTQESEVLEDNDNRNAEEDNDDSLRDTEPVETIVGSDNEE